MTIALTINGSVYDYPESGDEDWGNDATDWAEAVTGGMLQKAGGSFFLLAEVDFGATYGLKSIYYKSRTANPASAGQVRLARADVINWRNQANDGDLPLAVNSSDLLTFNGTVLQNTLSVTDTATIDLTLAADVLSAAIVTGSITNAMVNASAAIAYSKLNLATSIVNADISGSAAIAYSKLNLATSIVNADISASAAIAYSKLAALTSGNILVGSAGNVATSVAMSGDITISNAGVTAIGSGVIVNADVNASAAIALSKLAATTASRALVSDGSGFVSAATTTATEIGYVNGVTSAIQTQLDAKVLKSLYTAKGDLVAASAANTPATFTVGTDGLFLQANSANATGLGWAAALANPMDADGQMIYGGALGVATKLAAGTSNQVLQSNGAGAPTWVALVNANISASAAIAYSKLALTGSIVNADVNASAAIAYSKLALTGSIVNADVNASAAIAYSKLALTGSIVNADVNASAAIAVSKLATVTASRALVSDGSGFVSAATTTATQIGYLSAATGTTGTTSTNIVYSTSPTLVTPTLGVASATSVAAGLGLVGTPAFTFTGDLNTGMWSAGADTLNFSTAGADRLNISSAGLVTIGTSGGTQTHVINGTQSTTGTIIAANGTATAPSIAFVSNTDTGLARSASNRLDFITAGANSGNIISSVWTIGASGGTSTHLTNGAMTYSMNGSGANVGTTWQNNASGTPVTWQAGIRGDTSNVFAITNGTLGFALSITTAGVMTINNLAGAGSRAVNASAAGALSAASDSRLKQEVRDVHLPGLEEIKQLRPVAYKWLDDIERRGDKAAVEIGFFANEAVKVIPSAAPMGNDGYYGFYDRSVIAALVKSVHQLDARVASLESRLAN